MSIKNSSPFQIIGNRILSVNIDNSFFNLTDDNIAEKSFDYNSEIGNIIKDEKEMLGTVRLSLAIKIEGVQAEQQYSFDLTLEGCFSTNLDTDEDEFKSMLKINGSAALFSIARSFIIGTSSQTCLSGQIILPMVNFTISNE